MKVNLEASLRLKEIRDSLGLTQKEFASKIDFNSSYLSQIERGEKSITSKLSNILFVQFGVSSDWLLHGKGDKPKLNNVPNLGGNLAGQENSNNDKQSDFQLFKMKTILEALGQTDLPLKYLDQEAQSLYFKVDSAINLINEKADKSIDNEDFRLISDSLNEIISKKIHYMDFHLIGILYFLRHTEKQNVKPWNDKFYEKEKKFINSFKGDLFNDELPPYISMSVPEKLKVLSTLEEATKILLDRIWEMSRDIQNHSTT